jgi:hypothetical protein
LVSNGVAVWLRLKLVKRLLEQHGFLVETSCLRSRRPAAHRHPRQQARAMEQCVRASFLLQACADLARTCFFQMPLWTGPGTNDATTALFVLLPALTL